MNYFLSNLFRDWKGYALIGLAAVAGLNIMDFISFMLLGNGFFNLWVVRSTFGAAVVGAVAYGYYLHRREKRSRRLDNLLPAFIAARRAYFEKTVAEDRKFQTFCHECRHYDARRRRCLLRLHGRQVRIRLKPEDVFNYCLYWNLEEQPVLKLTRRIKELKVEQESPVQTTSDGGIVKRQG